MEHRKETQRLLVLSGLVDLGLGILKVLIGVFANSYALVVDGFHSLSDLLTDVMVWVFNGIGNLEPDSNHPYGHGRFETFGTLLLGTILIVLAVYMVYESVQRMLDIESYAIPTWPALAAAIASIAVKEWLYRITQKLGHKTHSRLLMANAWHHRSDAMSSVIVLIGVAGALAGVFWLELVAAIGVAGMIAGIGFSLARQSVEELVDTALSDAYVDEIKQKIVDVEGVKGVHSLRSRRMGAEVLVDIHLQVDSSISVSEGHHIGEWVTRGLVSEFSELNDIVVHIDAEDDEEVEERAQGNIAPLRREVRQNLTAAWADELAPEQILKLNLHYLNNQINVEVFLKSAEVEDVEAMQQKLQKRVLHLPWIRQVTVWTR